MDEHHLTSNDKTQHSNRTPNEDINNNQLLNKANPQISNTQDTVEEKSMSSVAQSQLCCSCRYEKAHFICTVCNENGLAANNFASTEHIVDKTGHGIEDNVYFSPSNPTPANIGDNIENQNEVKIPDAEALMRRGNMVYCRECFKDVHKAMSNNHKPIEVFQRRQEVNLDDTNQDSVDIEEECNKDLNEVMSLASSKSNRTITENAVDSEDINYDKTNVIIDLLNELVSISSSNLEQEEREEELRQQTVSSEMISKQMQGLFADLSNLNVRCEQFNDVKASIKQMNDLIRNDLFMDFGTITTMIRVKLDEVTNNIKEKLKDAYSVVRDTQTRIANKITEIKALADRIQMLEALQRANNSPNNSAQNLSLDAKMSDETILEEIGLAYEKIRQINEELRRITETSRYVNPSVSSIDSCSPTSTSTSCSLFVDNSLYPKFNYFVDTRKLVEAINEIDVQIGSRDILNPKTYFLGNPAEEDNHEPLKYSNNSSFFCMITSGISNEGSFWLQLNFKNDELRSDPHHQVDRNDNNKINLFIEEISKYVRKKRIGDKNWQTYAEANRIPEANDKCFCLEPKSRKWLRAKVVCFNVEEQACQVRFMDTGNCQFESNKFSLDQVLVWKDFDLAMYPARTIKCVLYKECDLRYENSICLETKFLFKDSLANRSFKCELVEPLEELIADNIPSDELTWIVKLHELNKPSTPDTSINAQIIKYNEHELLVLENKAASRNKFSSIDIRVESGTVGATSQLVKTHCSDNNNPNLVSTSSSFSASNNTEKQTDSDSTTRATGCHTDDQVHIASSVNSFSEKFEAKEQQHQHLPKENSNTACSLPIIQPPDAKVVDIDLELEAIKKSGMVVTKAEVVANHKLLASEMTSKVDSNNNDTSTLHCTTVSPESMDPSTVDENINLDIEDQSGDRRYFRNDNGICVVNQHITADGVFWIKPICEASTKDMRQLAFSIGQFITKTQWKSFSELHIKPSVGKKCFFKKGPEDWARGQIETSFEDGGVIRNLDTGSGRNYSWDNVYPHRRLANSTSSDSNVPFNIPKYLAIRCVISREPVKLNRKSQEMFKLQMQNKRFIDKRFDLIEQVMVKNQKCWFTAIRHCGTARAGSTNTINGDILDYQKSLPQSKSTDIITSLRINDDEQMNAMQSSVSLQHHTGNTQQDLTENQNYLINQTMSTIQKLNAMGASYLLQPHILKQKSHESELMPNHHSAEQNLFAPRLQSQYQNQIGSLGQCPQHSLPVYPGNGRDETSRRKKRNTQRRRQKETKDDLVLDSSFSERPCGRRRSRSADSITREDAETTAEKKEEFRKLAAEQKKPTGTKTIEPIAETSTATQVQTSSPAQNSFHQKWTDPQPQKASSLQPVVGRNNKSSSDVYRATGKGASSTSRKPVSRKSTPNAKDSCRDSGQQGNRNHRRHDDDDRGGPGPKPGWNYGGGASGSYNRPWRQTGGSGQGGDSRQGNSGNNGRQAAGGIYKASILNHFPNNHTDCRVISPSTSSQQVPYVVKWACDDNELNSSAFNDVFIEDNYCTTENDYDSQYGDDSDELDEPISDSEHPKSQYEFYENPIEFSDINTKRVSMQSVSSDCLSKIRVSSLRDISNVLNEDEVDNVSGFRSMKQLSKTRCVYSIKPEPPSDIVAAYLNDDMSGYANEEIEVNRGFDAGKSNFGTAFLNKWNTNLAESNQDEEVYDLLADSSLDKSDVLINNNDVTTLDLTARHIHLSPGLSGDGEISATKCIRPQMSGYNNQRFMLPNNRQPQQQLQQQDYGNETLQVGGRRNQVFLTSSSGGLSDSSQRRRPIVHSSTGTRNRTEDEENEFYISCAEIQSNNSSLIVENNDSSRPEIDMSHLFTKPTVHANKSAQTESSLVTKLEKLKQFTTVVFVDSIEDYSFDKNNESSSPGLSYTNDLNLSNIPTINYNRNLSFSLDLEDDVFQSRNRETPTPVANNKQQENEFFKFNIAVNKSTFIQQNTGDYNSDSESRSPSLKEFETIEKSQEKSQPMPKQKSPIITDEIFMYQTNNYNLANSNNQALTSKPPLGPNVMPAPNNGNNANNQKAEAPLNQLLNASNHLSTIEECSNETFESACSNASRNPIHQKSHSTSYEEDGDDQLNSDWTIDKKTIGDMSQNITLRRGGSGHSKRSVCVDLIPVNDENENTMREADNQTLTGHTAVNPTADLATSVTITDKLFEKFCLVANDEIMAYPSMVPGSFTDSLEPSGLFGDCTKWDNATKERKINSKLLNEILDAHISEPGSSTRSSTSSHQKDTSPNNGSSAANTNEPASKEINGKNNIFSSSSCSKLSSVTSKQTVVAVSGKHRDSNNSTVFGSFNNLNANQIKGFGFEDDEMLDDDDVFVSEKNGIESLNPNLSSGSEINIDQKISSKSLNSINERKVYISNKTSSLPPSATTLSTEPSFPMLNASSASTRSLTNRNKAHKYKQQQQQQQQLLKNNLSTTTLEISSYMSDSLYNSNFIVTPMCSEAMSPALFTNHFIKSPNIPQGSPLNFTSNSMFSSSLPNNPMTPKTFANLRPSALSSSPPPPPPINNNGTRPIKINTSYKTTSTMVFPSPPSMSIKCNSPIATPTDSSFPLPPTFLDSNNIKDKTSTMELEVESQTSNSTESIVQANNECYAKTTNSKIQPVIRDGQDISSLAETKKAPSVKQTNAPQLQKSSLIETLTARLNLATETKGTAAGGPLGSLFNTKQKPMAPVAPTIHSKSTDWSKQSEVKCQAVCVDSKSQSPRSNNHDDTANNALSDLNTADYNRAKLNATDEVDGCSGVKAANWKAANFGCSLYGLDTDEDEKSSMDKQQNLLTKHRQDVKYSAEELDSSLPLPPPPIGFDDNNNEVDAAKNNKVNCHDYENVDMDFNLIEQISKEFQKNAGGSSYSPLFIDQSRNSNNCTVTTMSNDILNEEPTKEWSTVPMTSQTSTSATARNPTNNQNPADMSQKQWKNLTCETLTADHNRHTSLLPESNLLENQKLLQNHMKGKSTKNKIATNQNSNLHMSCPTILSNNINVANTTKTSDVHDYKNDEFLDEITTLTSEGKREFKLDKLLDINPKRLYKGSKFRCRIHDVIDQAGRFWIEVIYSKEDERKFLEILRLFRLCSRVSQPPASVHPEMCVSALYKEEWYRAIVLETTQQSIVNDKVRVRFVDLGIIKTLDRQTELREIDKKFFNCPLKALHCSINLDKDVFDEETCLYQNEELKQFRFSKQARKYFTKIIYKRVLYAKVVNFTYECMDSDTQGGLTLSHRAGEKHSICQIILGAQFQRGIVDIFMYLLSKFDRSYYTVLKQYHSQQQKLVKDGVIQETDVESSRLDTQTCTQQTNTATHVSSNNNSNKRTVVEDAEVNAQGEAIFNKELLQIMKDEFIQSYGKAIENNTTPMEQEHAVISDIGNDVEADFTEDDESTIEETEQPLYSNSINRQDHRLHETFTISSDTSSESYFSVSDEDDFEGDEEADELDNEQDLEFTPVKGFDNTNNSCRSFNYSPLRINSIHLPPINSTNSTNQSINTVDVKTPVNQYTEHSTAQVRGDRKRPGEIKLNNATPTLPLARPVKLSKHVDTNNASSDTDTSLVAPCCTGLHKFKWNSATKLRQKIVTLNKSKECPELSFQTANENNYVRNKKVKFEIK